MNDRNRQENVEISVSSSAETWQNTSERRQIEKIIEPVPSLKLFFWSILVSLTSVINPLLTNLATNLQSQNLYASWALTQGEVAYANIYGTSGLLYYLVSWLGNLFLGQLLFLLFQVVALTLAGIYLFQTISQITVRSGLARQITVLFYLFVLTLGFGGTYSIIFAFPFIFRSLYHLVKYLQGRVRDESFIRFGMVGALAFLIEPAFSLLFYSLTTLFLLLYNIAEKRKARGFYQLLAGLLGFSLVFYPLGYYTVLNGSFGVAISQATYVLEAFRLNSSYLLDHLLYYGLLFLGLGFTTALMTAFAFKEEPTAARGMRFIGLLGLPISFVGVLGLPEKGAYQLLITLPFALLLLALWLDTGGDRDGHERRHRKPTNASSWNRYLGKQLFLPLLAMLYLLAYPFVNEYILSNGVSAERNLAAQHIRENSTSKDSIYAWDNTASLYKKSQRLSAVSLLSPSLYTGTEENRIFLRNALNEASPKFILVNKNVKLFSDIKKKISQDYEEVDLELNHFKLYQSK
ncbi:heme transporter CcmD [uncultured Streptococcus sp.]|uniref:heme transporter CcmD n=1 Tax=uncultured Streptococcus sp. TaxID=83427 RepID=UPI002603B193|nr:heme transporter CcmD [uncultured Streptococcus sp.]